MKKDIDKDIEYILVYPELSLKNKYGISINQDTTLLDIIDPLI